LLKKTRLLTRAARCFKGGAKLITVRSQAVFQNTPYVSFCRGGWRQPEAGPSLVLNLFGRVERGEDEADSAGIARKNPSGVVLLIEPL